MKSVSLRRRMIGVIAGVLVLITLILIIALYAEAWTRALDARAQTVLSAKALFKNSIYALDIHRYPKKVNRLLILWENSNLVSSWRLVNSHGVTLTHNDNKGELALNESGEVLNRWAESVIVYEGAGEKWTAYFIPDTWFGREKFIDSMLAIFLVMGFGCILLVGAVYMIVVRFVAVPIENVVRVADSLAVGELTARIKPLDSSLEMNRLTTSFNRMAMKLEGAQELLESEVKEAKLEVESQEKEIARAQRVSAMGRLAAGVAHEINNPLSGMRNAVETLQTRVDNSDERSVVYINLVRDGLIRIQGLVGQLLGFARQKTELDFVDVRKIVENACAFTQHRMERSGITLAIDVKPNTIIWGNESELQQVVLNVMLNAIDSVEEIDGAGKVIITTNTENENVVLNVLDNGKGIDKETEQTAFDLFFTTKGSNGTGLGLAICDSIMRSHNGMIYIDSVKEGGVCVRIVCPTKSEALS